MADLTSSLRRMRGPFLSDDDAVAPQLTAEENRAIPSGPFGRGVASSVTNISAGATAREAFAAEKAGTPNASSLRAQAGELARMSEEQAPNVRSIRDVHSAADLSDYLVGGLGGMVPYVPPIVAGAAAGRILGPSALRAITPTVGSSAALYPMEKGQALLDQYNDPVQAAAPIDQRDNVATTRALINAGVLGGAANMGLRGLMGRSASTTLGAAVEGALPMAASTAVSTEAQRYLNPAVEHDPVAYADALIQGGALGAGAHIPSALAQRGMKLGQRTADMARDAASNLTDRFRRDPNTGEDVGPPSEPIIPGGLAQDAKEFVGTVNDRVVQPGMQAAADMFKEAKPKAKEAMGRAGDYVDETVKKFNEAAKTAEDFPDFMKKAFGDETTDMENLAAGDKSPEFKNADGSINEEKLFASDEPRRAKTEQNANDMLADPDTSQEIRDRIRSYNGDYSSPEAQTFINNARLGQRSAQRARDAIKTFKEGVDDLLKKAKDSVPDIKKAAGEAIDNAKDAIIKKNKQDPKLPVEVESTVFRNLKDELQAQPAIIKQVPELAKVISKLLSQGASIDDASLKAFGNFHALNDLFTDPPKALEKIAKTLGADDLYKRRAKFTTAYEDSKKPDSMLFKAIPVERRDEVTAPQLKQLGRFIDELGGKGDKEYQQAIEGLSKVYGSKEAAIAVVDYYTRANESELKIESDRHPQNSDDIVEGTHDAELANQGIQKQDIPQDVVFASVDKKHARPWHRTEMKRLGEAINLHRGATGEGRRESMSTYAFKEGKSYTGELGRIERDIKQRIEDHKAHKEYAAKDPYRLQQVKNLEDQLAGIQKHKDTVNKDEMFAGLSDEERADIAAGAALGDFYVARMKGEKADKTVADDEFIRDSKFGYTKAKQATRDANKDQFVEFEKTDGKTLTLHAPSMVRAMSRRQGQHGDETSRNRGARLFKESVGAILERPDIAGVKSDLKKVRFEDEATVGAADAEQQYRTAKVLDANQRLRKAQRALYRVLGKINTAREYAETDKDWAHVRKLEAERDALKAEIGRAKNDGADDGVGQGRTEKQEREEAGLTDIVKDILDKEGGTRLTQEMGKERRENDLRTSSPGKYDTETPHDIKKAIHDLKKQLEQPGTPAEKKRIRDEMAALTRRLRVVEAAEPKNTETLRERAQRNARREEAAKARTKEALDNFVGKDEEPELRGSETPGTLGDADKTRPDYLKRSGAERSVKSESDGRTDQVRSSAFYGKDEYRARVDAANKAIDEIASKYFVGNKIETATAKLIVAQAHALAEKGFFADGEFRQASHAILKGLTKLEETVFRNLPPDAEFRPVVNELHNLREKVFQVLIPMSRKTEAHVRTLVDEALGKDFELAITPYINASTSTAGHYGIEKKATGGWTPEKIRVSSLIAGLDHADPDSGIIATAHHEIMHAVATRIERLFGADALKQLVDAVHQDHIKEQVFKAVENVGEGFRKYLEDNPEEMFVETYAQWRMGKVELKPIDKRVAGFFERIKSFVRSLFNLLEKDDLVRAAFEATKRGEFKDMPQHPLDVVDSFEARNKAGLFKQEGGAEKKTTAESRLSEEIHRNLNKAGIPATHDSPIRHEGKFDWRKHILKGEGAAVYGAGTYLSTKDGVHRSYKNNFTAKLRGPSEDGVIATFGGENISTPFNTNKAYVKATQAERDIMHALYKSQNSSEPFVLPFANAKAKESIRNAAKDDLFFQIIRQFDQIAGSLEDSFLDIDKEGNAIPTSKAEDALISRAQNLLAKYTANLYDHAEGPPYNKRIPHGLEVENLLGDLEGVGKGFMANTIRELIKEYDGIPDREAAIDKVDLSKFGSPKANAGRGYEADKSPTYHVTVNARDEHIMDWDAPLREQSKYVQNALAKLIGQKHEALPQFKKWYIEKTTYGNQEHVSTSVDGKYTARIKPSLSNEFMVSVIDNSDPKNYKNTARSEFFPSILDAKNNAHKVIKEANDARLSKRTGEDIYRSLSKKLGSDAKASDALQDAGIVGHKYASDGQRDKKFPNYVIYDDSKIETNYVHFSKENAETGRDMTPEEAVAVREHVLKTRGPDVQVITDRLAKDIGGSGSYYKDNVKRVVEIARDALNPLSVAHHESMHDFFHTLLSDEKSRRIKTDLLRAADIPYVQAQLRALLKDHPDALAQVMKDPEERLSYMYQFWAAGKLRVSPTANTVFGKVMQWLRDVIGVVSTGQKADAIMTAFHNGKLADPSIAGSVIADLNMKTVGERLEKITGPIAKYASKLLTPATEQLHNSTSPALRELAEMFHKEPGRESGDLAFIQKRGQMGGKFSNKLQDVIGDASHEDMALALKELQSMQPPTTELGKNIRKLLDELHDYMTERGVMNSSVNPKTKAVEWSPIRRVKNYFPRVWDRNDVRAKSEELKALFMKEGDMRADEADTIIKSILSGDGAPELAENEHHVGFTPYSSAVKNRGLTFINEKNAHLFEPFQNKDLINVMHTYIYQAVHRGEYAKFFGNDGEKIKELLQRAKKEGLSEAEVMDAAKTVRALEGTLGADINPRLRELYSGVVGYENIVLLPFAIFSSLIDPLGVSVRSGKMADAAIAFKDGVKGIFQDLFRMDKDAEYEMARTIGVIDDLNKMEAMGQVMNSQYMSGWMRKFNDHFFKWNGMETWNERMRVSAMGAGMRFMVRNAKNERYMEELGLKPGDIKELNDGKIARTTDEGLSKEQEQRVQEALYRFVDGAILRPNAAHRPAWASDPHFMLVAHLKQYTFSFQQTILKQVKKEFQNGNNMPAFVLASYIPFMAASDLMRGSITGSIKGGWTLSQFLADGVARSGVLGTGSFVTDAMKDASMGKMPGSSFLGPAFQHLVMAIQTGMGAPGTSWHDLALRSMPASPLSKAIE